MRWTTWIAAWVAAGFLVLGAGGCGRSGPERRMVTGKVTYRGAPVEKGMIRFFPIKDVETPA